MFKIRASSAHHIMTGSIGLTDKQKEELLKLEEKEKITEIQKTKLETLINKRDNIELPSGVKTHCKNWRKSKLYNRRASFSSKYTQKGHIVEDNSIDFVANYLDYGMLMKNEKFFESEYMMGTPDVILKDHLIDVKNSWSWETFPLFEDEIPDNAYYWQAQVYMNLVNRDNYKLIYVLSDTPINLIEREAFYWCKNNGYDELQEDVYNRFLNDMTYNDIDNNLKIKVFNIERNQEDINEIEKRVIECRKYISLLK